MFELHEISPREAYANYMLGKAVFLDVRETDEPDAPTPALSHLRKVPLSELYQRYHELPTDSQIIVLSRVGNRSHDATRFLLRQGFHDVNSIEGGIQAWADEGFPVVSA